MKSVSITLMLLISTHFLFSQKEGVENRNIPNFTENKGQIKDQKNKPRPDILFYGSSNGFNFYLKNTGISYQLSKVITWKNSPGRNEFSKSGNENVAKNKSELIPDQIKVYRVDLDWIGVNSHPMIITDKSIQGFNNYYTDSTMAGVKGVRQFNGITYKNIYHNIDLHYYQEKYNIKYDYIIKPHHDYRQIKFEIKGATVIVLSKEGKLLIKTPFGEIREDAPIAYQSGKKLKASWVITDKNCLTFNVENYDKNKTLIIDPLVRVWGTYYGGNYDDVIYSSTTDKSNNVYIAGYTNSQILIATTGAHQTTFGSSGNFAWNKDAFIVKFDGNGNRLWGTYYGDWNYEEGIGCATDKSNNVYLSGLINGSGTSSTMATPGAYMTSAGAGFLAKFDSLGIRVWSTYYHGPCGSCVTDGSDNIYVSGLAYSQTTVGIFATASAHQTTFNGWSDCFIAKFNSTGQRIWSTYYGGPYSEFSADMCTDQQKNIFLSGYTNSNIGTFMATVGAHQTSDSARNGYDYDAFLVKFDSSGIRQWGTYYGGSGFDWGYSTTADLGGNVYLVGKTSGSTSFTTTNGHQINAGGGGNYDGFLAKFSPNGTRLWGSLYGGVGEDFGSDCMTDKYYNFYMCGSTGSSLQIASPNAYQSSPGGDRDAFLAKFDSSGTRVWGTYYGGNLYEFGKTCAIDRSNNIFLAGITNSSMNIVSSGSFLDSIPGGTDCYLVKFSDCGMLPSPPSQTPLINQTVCANTNATLSVLNIGDIQWYATPVSTISLGSGNLFIVQNVGAGTYSFYAEVTACITNPNRTEITLTVAPTPTINISGPDSICSGAIAVFSVNGNAQTYNWSNNGIGTTASLSPTLSTILTVTGTAANNCISTASKPILVNLRPNLTIVANSNHFCEGDTVVLTALGAQSLLWNDGTLGPTMHATPATTTSYSVQGTDVNSCTSSTSIAVIVHNIPALTITSTSSVLCVGESATLSATGASSYTWASGIGQSINIYPIQTMTYLVTGENSEGCTANVFFTQNVSTCTKIEERKSKQVLNIFPNPNNGHFSIDLPENSLLTIHSIEGKIILSTRLPQGLNKINLDNFAKGFYIIKIYSGEVYLNEKILIE